MIATDKEAKVELKNVRIAGSLAIRKKIEGKDPISEREFSFTAATPIRLRGFERRGPICEDSDGQPNDR